MSLATLHGPRRMARRAFVLVAVAFAAGVTIQVFIAGLATFGSPVNWASHVSFVNILQPLPFLMLFLGFVGRWPESTKWQSAALVALIYVQFVTAHMTGMLPWVAAAHPVTAMVLFWMSVRVATSAWRLALGADVASEAKKVNEAISVPAAIAETQ